MKMLKFVLRTVIFLILFSGCAGKAEQSSQIDLMETAPSSVKEPAEIPMADSSKLPAGYEVLEEPDRLLITDNGKIIGAIETYPISNDMMFDPYYRWLETLGI